MRDPSRKTREALPVARCRFPERTWRAAGAQSQSPRRGPSAQHLRASVGMTVLDECKLSCRVLGILRAAKRAQDDKAQLDRSSEKRETRNEKLLLSSRRHGGGCAGRGRDGGR